MKVFDFLFGQYSDYSVVHIVFEAIAIIASVISVLYSKKNNILVFPYGIISTGIFVYLLNEWNLVGDMIINIYYFIMSIYGWYIWTRKDQNTIVTPISQTVKREWMRSTGLFLISGVFVYFIYWKYDRFENWVSYIDILTTSIAFVGMYLMALRKIEYWLVLLVANVISVPLYFYKGYGLTALLFIFLSIIAWLGYQQWKKYLNKEPLTV
ncbi:MAG: nicotinamide riboside transporter PnuC [Nonlabens sp.]|uniref:nicotinamide riboside transporter PnuC n=1 Tax=Nonlabens sp. TaxID=1888209 RepID=UPI00321AC390